jgi:hypothetical protein
VARGAVPAAGVDGLEDQPALEDAEAGAPVLRRDQRGQVARTGELGDERLGIGPLLVELPPVLARIALADLGHARLQGSLLVGQGHAHRRHGWILTVLETAASGAR